MPRRNRLTISNFGLGMIRDAALEQDGAYSLYTLKNADIVYDGVFAYLRKRQGSDAYNATAFAAETKQIHHFIDSSQNERLLVVANNKLYRLATDGTGALAEIKLNGTTSHVMTTPPYPFVNAGDRCFFSDDNDWHWVDNTSLAANTSYQAGIDKPVNALQVSTGNVERYYPTPPHAGSQTISSSQTKLAQSFKVGVLTITGATQANPCVLTITNHRLQTGMQLTISGVVGMTELNGNTYTITVTGANTVSLNGIDSSGYGAYVSGGTATIEDMVYITSGFLAHPYKGAGNNIGHIRFRVETDSSGSPSGTLVESNAYTTWIELGSITDDTDYYVELEGNQEFIAGTSYWLVMEADNQYIYGPGANIGWYYDTITGYANGVGKGYDGSTWVTLGPDQDFIFVVIGQQTWSNVYNYKFGYHTTDILDESLPSDETPYYAIDAFIGVLHGFGTAPGGVDEHAFYRTALGGTSYYHLQNVSIDYLWVYDGVRDDSLVNPIQTADHYRLSDEHDTERSPIRLEFWKQRLWATVSGEDKVRFSKVLEEDGSLGETGNPSLVAFPADNFIDAKTSGYVQALKRLGQDALAVYYDDSIGIIYGADLAENPPTDLQFRMILYDDGLIAPRGVADFRGMHLYLSRHGVFTFNGTAQTESITSGFLQSILDGISDTNLALSIMGERDGELWLLVDADADGELETFLLFDTKQKRPTWRQYEYNFNANDFVILDSGNYKNRVIVATDLSDFKLRRLHSGNADTSVAGADVAVEATLETHPMRSMAATQGHALRERSRYIGAGILPYFPTATVPTFTTTITDRVGSTTTLTNDFAPSSNTDKRAFHVGLPRIASEEARLKIAWSSVNRDEIREVSFDWLEL